MGPDTKVITVNAADLMDYADTTAAIHLLKEALTDGAMITVGAAKEVVNQENVKEKPKISNVIREIMSLAGKPGDAQSKWVKDADGVWHLEAAITIGGAVYTADFTLEGMSGEELVYKVNIQSKLAVDNVLPSRGKLFFNPGHKATVTLTLNGSGDLIAVTKHGLMVGASSFSNRPYQTEIVSKLAEALAKGEDANLVIAGTGSGKSIIMAGIAQGVDCQTVMIVPDALLAGQQRKEVQSMLGAGKVNGTQVPKPNVFTFENFNSLNIDMQDLKNPKVIAKVKEYFEQVRAKKTNPVYDHIVLAADNPLFGILVPQEGETLIKDAIVLIDEAHTFTFTPTASNQLQQLIDHNAVTAFTATPNEELYKKFNNKTLDDMSLGAAIDLGAVRAVQAKVGYSKTNELVPQAVINYFNDYYLRPGSVGYTDPVKLKAELMAKDPKLSDADALNQAIDMAMKRNHFHCQRNMVFSDDKKTRVELNTIFQKIADGDVETINKYKDKIAELRRQSEVEVRLAMALRFVPNATEEQVKHLREEIDAKVKKPVVNLQKDIHKEQLRAIQRTINSYALSLIFDDKPASIGEKDRMGKLEAYVQSWDKEIAKYHAGDAYHTNKDIPPHMLKLLERCNHYSRAKLREELLKKESPIPDLPEKQREAMIEAILDRAEGMYENIRFSQGITKVVMNPKPLELEDFGASDCYSCHVDTSTPDDVKKGVVAMLEAGLATHAVSDQTLATGVSIKDVLSTEIVNGFSFVVDPNPNSLNGTTALPQAAGRPVRHTDGEGVVIQCIDDQYLHEQEKGKEPRILLVTDAIATASAEPTKKIIDARAKRANIEHRAALKVQSFHRAHQAREPYAEHAHQVHELYAEHKDEVKKLNHDIEECTETLKLQRERLNAGLSYLSTLTQQLEVIEDKLAKANITGNRNGDIPPQYRDNQELVTQWSSRKMLPKLIKHIKEENKAIADAMKVNKGVLEASKARREEIRAEFSKLESGHDDAPRATGK